MKIKLRYIKVIACVGLIISLCAAKALFAEDSSLSQVPQTSPSSTKEPSNIEASPSPATENTPNASNPTKDNTSEQNLSGDPTLGQTKSQICATCHGPDGNTSTAPNIPKLGGQIEKYLVKELKEFRKGDQGKRFDPVMSPMAQPLSDSDIADLAAYFSKQTSTVGTVQAQYLSLGEKIYRGGNLESGVPACIACHGVVGEGNPPALFPKLSGQNPTYTAAQLKKFRSGERKDDANGIMQGIAKHMTDQEIEAVSSYVSGYH